jgi:RNA polymerase sigma-70 factor (ECF subfamily)
VDEALQREMLAFLPRLRRFTYGLTGSAHDGDDLLQATCERAIRHIDKWQPGTRLDSWMYRIARNLHLNDIRAKGVRSNHLSTIDPDDSVVVDGAGAMEWHMTFQAVRGFVDRLPEEQRTILLLITVEGLSYREVAELLELPLGTVTSRLARARMALKSFLGGDDTPRDSERPNGVEGATA